MKEFFRKLFYDKPLVIFVCVLAVAGLSLTLYKGEVEVDENGYAESAIMDLHYKYDAQWERIPTEISQTLYIKDEEGNNELLITMYAYPLQIFGATNPEDGLAAMEKAYVDVYETQKNEPIVIDGEQVEYYDYYSEKDQFGGRIYLTIHNNIGYTIMFTVPMTGPTKFDNPIVDQFLGQLYFN